MPEIVTRSGNRLWEEQFLSEYLAAKRPEARVMFKIRLGPQGVTNPDPTLTESERRMLGAAFRRWADAILVDRGTLVVVEAAMVPDPRDISLVQTYLLLVDHTPELRMLADLPRRGLLVWAVDDPYSRAVAVAAGLEVDVWKPSHFGEWLAAKRARETRPARTLD